MQRNDYCDSDAYVLDTRGREPCFITIPWNPSNSRYILPFPRMQLGRDRQSFDPSAHFARIEMDYLELDARPYAAPGLGWFGWIYGDPEIVAWMLNPIATVLEFLLWVGRLAKPC